MIFYAPTSNQAILLCMRSSHLFYTTSNENCHCIWFKCQKKSEYPKRAIAYERKRT
uniref:Uncharacterized protein n=1 Tax=Rhizophora mucronata TaxID=61149 RepID=A0A2P2QF71_RHIMU